MIGAKDTIEFGENSVNQRQHHFKTLKKFLYINLFLSLIISDFSISFI